jgi:hypothetical protein
MEPEVLYFILCDTVRPDPANLHRFNIFGLIAHLRSRAAPPFPLVRPQFSILIVLTGCQGEGELSVRIIREETATSVFRNAPRRVRFSGALQDAVAFSFGVRDCSFPAAGLYWVECVFSGTVLARQRLSVIA